LCSATIAPAIGGATWVLTLTVAGGPVAHVRAIGRYSIVVHLDIDDHGFESPSSLLFEDGTLVFSVERPGTVPTVRIALVLTDPVGRAGAPSFLTNCCGDIAGLTFFAARSSILSSKAVNDLWVQALPECADQLADAEGTEADNGKLRFF
jgi:hypothetical protein